MAPFVYTGVQMLSPRLLDGWVEQPFSTNLMWDLAIAGGRAFGERERPDRERGHGDRHAHELDRRHGPRLAQGCSRYDGGSDETGHGPVAHPTLAE